MLLLFGGGGKRVELRQEIFSNLKFYLSELGRTKTKSIIMYTVVPVK